MVRKEGPPGLRRWARVAGLMEEGSRSYSVMFQDPNGVSFEIFAEPLTALHRTRFEPEGRKAAHALRRPAEARPKLNRDPGSLQRTRLRRIPC